MLNTSTQKKSFTLSESENEFTNQKLKLQKTRKIFYILCSLMIGCLAFLFFARYGPLAIGVNVRKVFGVILVILLITQQVYFSKIEKQKKNLYKHTGKV